MQELLTSSIATDENSFTEDKTARKIHCDIKFTLVPPSQDFFNLNYQTSNTYSFETTEEKEK